AGAGLLRDLITMKSIAETVVKNSSLPVTLKTRLGWDEKSVVILDVAKMCEDIGIFALTVHCRFRNQANKGFADWSWIKQIKDAGIKIPIILNGNIHTPEDVKTAFEEFEADSVMIGQAAINNPWIFRQSKFYLKNGYYEPDPTIEERLGLCLEHLQLAVELKGEKYGVIEFRKHFAGYLRNLPNISKLRLELMQLKEFEPVKEKLLHFKEHYIKIFEERCS
ncbi:MAG: tRNA dihydrouridine synthase, partial [Ignavibacteria bacterium]